MTDLPAEASVQAAPVQTMDKPQQAYREATTLFEKDLDWVTLFREILGKDGIVRKLYPGPEAMAEFEQTAEFTNIQQMLSKLRTGSKMTTKEPTRVITVRLPQSLHETLRAEAHDHHTSMNQLCISKLLQMVDSEAVPAETDR